jgi:hypothetical protein
MIKSTAEGRAERMCDLATNPSDAGGYGTITSTAVGIAVTAILMQEPFFTLFAAGPVCTELQRYSGLCKLARFQHKNTQHTIRSEVI